MTKRSMIWPGLPVAGDTPWMAGSVAGTRGRNAMLRTTAFDGRPGHDILASSSTGNRNATPPFPATAAAATGQLDLSQDGIRSVLPGQGGGLFRDRQGACRMNRVPARSTVRSSVCARYRDEPDMQSHRRPRLPGCEPSRNGPTLQPAPDHVAVAAASVQVDRRRVATSASGA